MKRKPTAAGFLTTIRTLIGNMGIQIEGNLEQNIWKKHSTQSLPYYFEAAVEFGILASTHDISASGIEANSFLLVSIFLQVRLNTQIFAVLQQKKTLLFAYIFSTPCSNTICSESKTEST
jgi:hypothetical protein